MKNKKISGRTLILILLSLIFIVALFVIIANTNLIYLNNKGNLKFIITSSDDIESIFKKHNIVTEEHDTVKYSNSKFITSVSIIKANKVTVLVDGQEKFLYGNNEQTLKDLLLENDVQIGEHDIISVDINTKIYYGMFVQIQRVSFRNREDTNLISQKPIYRHTPLLSKNQTKVLKQGQDGLQKYIYLDKIIDGNVVNTELVGTNIIKAPVSSEILTGNNSVPVSSFNFTGNLKLFKKNAVATAYNAKPGSKTASGMEAKVGHIAVNPKLIPYGTKLYIKASNGSFIYGYAVAADTGGFVDNGNADVDLYFDSYLESCLFGKQSVDIYIVS